MFERYLILQKSVLRQNPLGKVSIPILKELEHQARQNISTFNFTAAFAKTSSSCNATLEMCQHKSEVNLQEG